MAYTQRVFDRIFCADGTFIRNGTEWHERRRGALYCIIFCTHIFRPNIQSFVSYRRQELKGNSTFNLKGERAVEAEENAMA